MKVPVLVAAVCLAGSSVQAGQGGGRAAQAQSTAPDVVASAYEQFLLARHLESADDVNGAIAAYKRASQLDPTAADIVAELSALYLRQSRLTDATAAAEQALTNAPANREAHRVLGIVYATLAESGRRPNGGRGQSAATQNENISKAIQHLEQALEQPSSEPDPNVRATLARLYVATGTFDKAIPLLTALVNDEPGWNDGPALLAEAFAGAGRNAEAIQWLEQAAQNDPDLYATLGDFYERERRWPDAAQAFDEAAKHNPRSIELKRRYASALLNVGGQDALAKARAALTEVVAANANDIRALFQLSQAQRRLGDLPAAEATARRIIAQNARSPMGYYSLALALEERRAYQAVVDVLAPAVSEFRARAGASPATDLAALLPHLGFAYQQLGEYDKAIASLDEAHRLSPNDAAVSAYLIQAHLSAKKYAAAVDLARKAAADNPDDLRFARLEAEALRQSGKADEAIAVLQDVVKKQADQPASYVALAQLYVDTRRGGEAVKVLQDAQARFPDEVSIPFELGAAFEKQKRYAEAESAFRQVLAKEPDNAPALNYLGYMLADRGERLDESIEYLKKALTIEPDNGSYLDSLGWAYYKSDKLDLALDNLRRAAEQLKTNSVIQDHYGDALFKQGRYDEAVAAWDRALAGDGDSIERGAIDRKIRTAKQKLGRK